MPDNTSHEQPAIQALARQAGLHLRKRQGGDLIVRQGDNRSVLPMHGSNKELGKGLVEKIKKDLGL